MNPALGIIVIILCIIIWFFAAFLFKPTGKFVYRIWKDAIDEMKYEEIKEEEKEGNKDE